MNDRVAGALLRMLAFYLMVGYLLAGLRRPGQSLWARLLGPREAWLFGRRGAIDANGISCLRRLASNCA